MKLTCLEVEVLVKFIAITGFKESGKTKVVEGVVERLKKRGFSVGTVKHVSQEGFTIDREGTDTWRHAEAGAEEVCLLSPDETVTMKKGGFSLENFLGNMEGLDYVIVEGFRDSEIIPKVAIADNDDEVERLDDMFTVAFLKNGIRDKPVLDCDDMDSIVELVEDKAMQPVGNLDCGQCGFDTCGEFVQAVSEENVSQDECVAFEGQVTLKVDGREIPLKPFVKDLIKNTVSGMVSSLKEGDGDRIVLELNEDEG